MISDIKKEEIKKEAKFLLYRFSKQLEKVKLKTKKIKSEDEGTREESSDTHQNPDFKLRMFQNAPNKSQDFILAEKKRW